MLGASNISSFEAFYGNLPSIFEIHYEVKLYLYKLFK